MTIDRLRGILLVDFVGRPVFSDWKPAYTDDGLEVHNDPGNSDSPMVAADNDE